MDRLDVTPDGDLILVVSDELELRVYSMVLRLTSPVFKAMLGPDFTEGQKQGTAAHPKRLPLPEDDVTGMRLLCLVLHQANDKLPQTIESAQLLRFAVSVDKYRCTLAIALTTQAWFSAFQTPAQINDAVLCAAYLLDDAKSFGRLTGTVIKKSANPCNRRPHGAASAATTLIELGKGIAERIAELLREKYDPYQDFDPTDSLEDSDIYDPEEFPPKCGYYQNIVKAHLRAMALAGIWPRSSRKGSLELVLEAVKSFELVDDRSVMWCETCGWEGVLNEIKPAIDELKEEVAELDLSPCLDCMKRAGKSTKGQTCRVGHK